MLSLCNPASADAVLPFLPETLVFLPTRIVVTVVLALCVLPLCFASSLGSSVVLYSTWLSVTTYAAWVACTAYTHAQGMFAVSPTDESLGALWQGLSEYLHRGPPTGSASDASQVSSRSPSRRTQRFRSTVL